MLESMQIPVLTTSSSEVIGPAYADSNYNVIFDGVDDRFLYDVYINDGIGSYTSVIKDTGTYSGVALTYKFVPTYTDITTSPNTTKSIVTEGNTGATEFYLAIRK